MESVENHLFSPFPSYLHPLYTLDPPKVKGKTQIFVAFLKDFFGNFALRKSFTKYGVFLHGFYTKYVLQTVAKCVILCIVEYYAKIFSKEIAK